VHPLRFVNIWDYIDHHEIPWICRSLKNFFGESGDHQTLSYSVISWFDLSEHFLNESQKILVTLNENYPDLWWEKKEISQIFYVKSMLTHSSPSYVWFLRNHNWISFTVQNCSLSTVLLLLVICFSVIVMHCRVGYLLMFQRNVLPPFSGRNSKQSRLQTESLAACVAYSLTLKMDAWSSSETSINFHQLHSVTYRKTVVLLIVTAMGPHVSQHQWEHTVINLSYKYIM
jgi:hypothetical protein